MTQTLIISNYIRKVKVNSKRKPVYFEWNGIKIHITKKKEVISMKYCTKDTVKRNFVLQNSEIITPKFLSKDYELGVFTTNENKYVRKATETEMNGILDAKFKYLVIKTGTNTPVIVNEKVKHLPEYIPINGNYTMTSQHQPFNSKLIIEAIKNSFLPCVEHQLKKVKQSDYPIRILFEIYDTIKNFNDVDNHTELGNEWDIENRASFYIKALTDLLQERNIIVNDDRLHVTQPPAAIFIPVDDVRESKLVFTIESDERPCILLNETYKKLKKGEIK